MYIGAVGTFTPGRTVLAFLFAATSFGSTARGTFATLCENKYSISDTLDVFFRVPFNCKCVIFNFPAIIYYRHKAHCAVISLLPHVQNKARSFPVQQQSLIGSHHFIFKLGSVPDCLSYIVQPLAMLLICCQLGSVESSIVYNWGRCIKPRCIFL